MTLYVDSSALLKRYVAEHDSARADELLHSDPDLVTARHTVIEVRRNIARLLEGRSLADSRAAFAEDIRGFALVELDAATVDLSAKIAELTGARTLDALHLGAAQRAGGSALTFLTFDLRQAQIARTLGFTVVGA